MPHVVVVSYNPPKAGFTELLIMGLRSHLLSLSSCIKNVISAVPEIVSGQQNLVRLGTVPDEMESLQGAVGRSDKRKMDKKPHVLAMAYPAQGHVAPLMKLAYKLCYSGIKVTIVNTEFIHDKIMAAMPENIYQDQIPVCLVSIPDGLESDQDRKETFKLTESLTNAGPGHLQNLIEKINSTNNDEQITCVIADMAIDWALGVARNMGIISAAFTPVGIGSIALSLYVPKLIEAGIIDSVGIPKKDEVVSLSEHIPAWNPNELLWCYPGDFAAQKYIFHKFCIDAAETVKNSNWVIINSFYELEPSAYFLISKVLPVGPLIMSNHSEPFAGNFCPEDLSCSSWLDKQPAGSVIYAAFGSTTMFSQQQFDELAFGLELAGLPFLLVVRSVKSTMQMPVEFPEGYRERVAVRAKIVEWAPQEKVLSHESTACFFSHCGWNSTMEGITMGVPFLCWPYITDQFHNKKYICEAWRVGLGLEPDENGIVARHEIKIKIQKLLSDNNIKANSLKLKEMAKKSVSASGSSFKNFIAFVDQLKVMK